MKLDKAIEILEKWYSLETPLPLGKAKDALNLGIEAMKLVDYLHVTQVLGEDELLPGETK